MTTLPNGDGERDVADMVSSVTPSVTRKRGISHEALNAMLCDVEGSSDVTWYNDKLALAFRHGLITRQQLEDAQSGNERVVKCYLRSRTDDTELLRRLRLYAIVCSRLHHRLGLLMNVVACKLVRDNDDANLQRLFALSQNANDLSRIVLPLRKAPLTPDYIESVLTDLPGIDRLAPSDQDLAVQSSWNQGSVFLARRFVAGVKVHVHVHLVTRVKKLLRLRVADNVRRLADSEWGGGQHPLNVNVSEAMEAAGAWEDGVACLQRLIDDRGTLAVKQLYGGSRSPHIDDAECVDTIIAKLQLAGLWNASKNEPHVPTKEAAPVHPATLALHIEMAQRLGFQVFPHSGAVSRVHAHVDKRVLECMLRDRPVNARSLHDNLNLTPELWNARRRLKLKEKTRYNKRRKKRRKKRRGRASGGQKRAKLYVRRKTAPLPDGAVIRSVSTDGVAVSVVMKIPHRRPSEKLTAEEFAKKQLDTGKQLYQQDDTYVVTGDPGRRNLLVAATLSARISPLRSRPERTRSTRSWWLKAIGRAKQQAWEQRRRAAPGVSAALDALSQSGGRRSTDYLAWTRYLEASVANQDVLHREFLLNDERYVLRMERYGRRRSAISRAAQTVLAAVPNIPGTKVVVGYGDASVKSHGRGPNDVSVPVKKLYREIIATLKRRRLVGVVLKVWEHRTTKTCYRCGHEMETMYQKDENGENVRDANGKKVEDRNFRRCNHCTEGSPKVRDRDFNAAINIMLALIAELEGRRRPMHLCAARRRRNAA